MRLPLNFAAIGFIDYGTVRMNRDDDYTGAAHPNTDTLKGAGLLARFLGSGFRTQHQGDRGATDRAGRNPRTP